VLEHLFTATSTIFKHLGRHLGAQLPMVLRHTAALRYHSADYVRVFAAQAVGGSPLRCLPACLPAHA
jgi:hypothetical protein